MRNGQQKRMRGRNNNRRGSNPLTRVYESNGPDVKVRGTAHHIAEKYQQLARDAQSSGDPVAAENYFQHAEHYLRLIASLQGQFAPQSSLGREDEGDEDDGLDDVSALDAPQPFMREQGGGREPRDDRDGRDNRRNNRDNRDSRDNRDNRDRDNRQGNFRRQRHEDEVESAPQVREPVREPVADEVVHEPVARVRPPRAPRAPRSEPRVEEEGQLGLPSFITGAPVVAKEPRVVKDAPPPAEENEDSLEAGEARTGRRRRRYRSRLEQTDEAAESGAPETEQQALPGE